MGCTASAEPSADAAIDISNGAGETGPARDGGDREAASDATADEDEDDAPRGLVVFPAQFVEVNTPLRMLSDGDPIDLWAAPQGGRVVLVAAKVRNLEGDTVILRVRARYPDTPFIVAEEGRSVKMVPVPGEPGTMQPDLETRTQVAHLPLCPDYDPMDIVNRPLEFALTVTSTATDAASQSGGVTLRLNPTCLPGSDQLFCQCECSANYTLGKCPRDAGTGD
jgi:hypothetical protein